MPSNTTSSTASNPRINAPQFEPAPAAFSLDHLRRLSERQSGWFIQEFRNQQSVVSRDYGFDTTLTVPEFPPPNYSLNWSAGVVDHDPDRAGGQKSAVETRQRYWKRIQALKEAAQDEGITINPDSVKDFCSFIKSLPNARRASLFLMDNGNFRAVWVGPDENRFGLQFLGGGQVQWLIFKRRPAARNVSRAIGTDTFDGVRRQILAFDLKRTLGI